MPLADKVRQLLDKRELSQSELSEASGITQATISRILRGQVRELKSETRKRLAEALCVTAEYLVSRTDKLTPDDIVGSDPKASYIFRGYERLSADGKEQLKTFVRFLEEQEKQEDGDKQ